MENTQEEFKEYLSTIKGLADYTIILYSTYYKVFPHTKELNNELVEKFLQQYNNRVSRAFLLNYLEFLKRKDLEIPKQTGRIKKSFPKTISEKEVEILQYAMNSLQERYGIMFSLTLQGGLRRGELINLKPADFEWDKWERNKDKPARLHIFGKGKRERIVLINSELMNRIRDYISEKIETGELNMQSNKMWKMGCHRWWKIMKDVSEGILGRGISPHWLRHTRATSLWNSGKFDIEDLRNFLGHSNLNTTQIYLHSNEEKSLKRFEEFIMK